jgi:hypothetical protein
MTFLYSLMSFGGVKSTGGGGTSGARKCLVLSNLIKVSISCNGSVAFLFIIQLANALN